MQFNSKGVCNACQWSIEKKKIDWKKRKKILEKLLYEARQRNKNFNVLVPVSGGDGLSSHMLKNKFKMKPLAVTATPLQLDVGTRNLKKLNADMILSAFTPILNNEKNKYC